MLGGLRRLLEAPRHLTVAAGIVVVLGVEKVDVAVALSIILHHCPATRDAPWSVGVGQAAVGHGHDSAGEPALRCLGPLLLPQYQHLRADGDARPCCICGGSEGALLEVLLAVGEEVLPGATVGPGLPADSIRVLRSLRICHRLLAGGGGIGHQATAKVCAEGRHKERLGMLLLCMYLEWGDNAERID